jgi:hypothetical protein
VVALKLGRPTHYLTLKSSGIKKTSTQNKNFTESDSTKLFGSLSGPFYEKDGWP